MNLFVSSRASTGPQEFANPTQEEGFRGRERTLHWVATINLLGKDFKASVCEFSFQFISKQPLPVILSLKELSDVKNIPLSFSVVPIQVNKEDTDLP